MDLRRQPAALLVALALGAAPAASRSADARPHEEGYPKHLIGLSVGDESVDTPPQLPEGIIDDDAAVKADPEAFWGGKGIWEDDRNYCRDLLAFVAASRTPDNFRYADDGQQVSLETLSADQRQIEGSYFIRSGPRSVARPCSVFHNARAGYDGVACVRIVSYGRPDVFASVYDRTLEDMRECLLPAGWEQASSDQGPCDPGGQGGGQCIRTFAKGSRFLWLFSNIVGGLYAAGVQTLLGE